MVPLTVNYYDDYTFQGQPLTFGAAPASGAGVMVKGLLTASKNTVLNTIGNAAPDRLWTVNYYDAFGRPAQTYAQHYLGGLLSPYNYDVVTNTYDYSNFVNELTGTTRQHYAANAGNTAPVLNAAIANTYAYDHVGRKTQTFEQINSGSNILLSQVNFNEIGQVMAKNLHSPNTGAPFLQSIAYTYNERGWLLSSSAPLFQMQLQYNLNPAGVTGFIAQYNGNIASQVYTSSGQGTKNFNYTYDYLNRLVNGTGSDGFSETGISYDLNGNIISLNRYQAGAPIDQLGYTYNNSAGYHTNQVQSIVDNSGNNAGLVAGTMAYGNYDPNGNMLSNTNTTVTTQNKSFTYNMLNLPQTAITATGGTDTYTYDATGDKLRKVNVNGSTTVTTDYISGIQYNNSTTTIGFIQTEEGKAVLQTNGSYDYTYYLGDNLGNTRITFDTQTSVAVMQQQDDYYPFGMEILRTSPIPNPKNEYLYNRKELQEELQQYDYGARFYDPVIARWTTIDPLAEASKNLSIYNYAENNPVKNIDPDGREVLYGQGQYGGDLYTGVEAQNLFRELQQNQQKQEKKPKHPDIYVHNKDGSVARYPDGGLHLRPDVKSKLEKELAKISFIENLVSLGTLIQGLLPKSPVVDENEEQSKGGAARAQKYSSGWGDASLNEAINKFAPDAEAVQNGSKVIYKNDQTGVQIVYDEAGNYFRIQDTKVVGKRSYTDMNGTIPANKVRENGTQTGRSQAEYNQITHFNNSDNK